MSGSGAAGEPAQPGASRSPVALAPRPGTRRRSWLEVRWRQFRGAPRPVVQAVASNLAVAAILGLAYLAYDVALTRGARLPGGDLRTLAVALLVVTVVVVGSWVTYLVVPQPTRGGPRSGSGQRVGRSPWSAALGFFAALPIVYLVLVLAVQVLKPLFV